MIILKVKSIAGMIRELKVEKITIQDGKIVIDYENDFRYPDQISAKLDEIESIEITYERN